MLALVQNWLLPWAMYAVSLFNLVLLLWLGLTVLLNAQGRSWGTWLAGSGLLLGAIFFLLHTIALDYSLDILLENSPIWWFIMAAPVVALPYGWLVLMLWYCGLTEDGAAMRWRVLMPALMATGLGLALVFLAIVSAPKLSISPLVNSSETNFQEWWCFHLGLWVYPAFLVLCTATALLALAHPAPSGQWQREASRRRAWPYLFASSIVQLLVSLAVAGALLYFGVMGAFNAANNAFYNTVGSVAKWLDATDFALCVGIAIAVMLLGKAVVSFEIFTGKILPRRGFWRQWRAVVLLAAIYAGLVATSMGFEMRGIYPLLLSTTLLGTFLAIFSHRAYADHARSMHRIAPFVSSGHLLEGLVSGDEARLNRAIDEPFRALCEDVLNAGRAALIPRAEIAPLFGEARVYPAHLPLQAQWREIATEYEDDGLGDDKSRQRSHSQDVRSLPESCGMDYLVPLGRTTPLGALLLGPRRDGGLYTLEEIEIARATGEHLLDSQSGATLAARLVALQREKVAEVVTLDRHARRVLHDEILPLLHAALLFPEEASDRIMTAHKGISNLLRELPVASPLVNKSFFEALKHEVEVELQGAFDAVLWEISPEAESFLETTPPFLNSTLFFAARESVRNAARHGRGNDLARTLSLFVHAHLGQKWELEICDDGAGLARNESSTFEPQNASPQMSGGSGSGLSLHAALLAVAGGSLSLEKGHSGGTRIVLSLPV